MEDKHLPTIVAHAGSRALLADQARIYRATKRMMIIRDHSDYRHHASHIGTKHQRLKPRGVTSTVRPERSRDESLQARDAGSLGLCSALDVLTAGRCLIHCAVLRPSRSAITMSNRGTAAPTREPDSAARPRTQRRSLTVAKYVGQDAADAAVAIRRAGLRPGLERSFGCEPELLGQVVHQEPPAGSEVARNAMITLHVAAPAATPAREESHSPPTDATQIEPAPAADTQADPPNTPTTLTTPRPRRRRKPGHAGRRPHGSDAPPAPAQRDTRGPIRPDASLPVESGPVADKQRTEEWFPDTGVAPPAALDQLESDEERGSDVGVDGESLEELVGYADDVFAGRTATLWHRVYPGRRRALLTPTRWS